MMKRPIKWYRSEKKIARPFLHRIWYGTTPMRSGRHQCRCASVRTMNEDLTKAKWQGWRRMFEPDRNRSLDKVWRSRRAVPYWTRKV